MALQVGAPHDASLVAGLGSAAAPQSLGTFELEGTVANIAGHSATGYRMIGETIRSLHPEGLDFVSAGFSSHSETL
jgi:hypothetical protein